MSALRNSSSCAVLVMWWPASTCCNLDFRITSRVVPETYYISFVWNYIPGWKPEFKSSQKFQSPETKVNLLSSEISINISLLLGFSLLIYSLLATDNLGTETITASYSCDHSEVSSIVCSLFCWISFFFFNLYSSIYWTKAFKLKFQR